MLTVCWILRTLRAGRFVREGLRNHEEKIFRPNHILSLHCLSAAARGEEENIGISSIGNSSAANSKSVCSPRLGDHAMYEVKLHKSSEGAATELKIANC